MTVNTVYTSSVCFSDHVPVAGRVTDGSIATKGWGRPGYKSLHKVILTCQYLKDDCIFLQVSKLCRYSDFLEPYVTLVLGPHQEIVLSSDRSRNESLCYI